MPPFTEPHVKKWKGKFSKRQKSRNSILEHNSPSMTEGRTFEQKKTLMEIHFSESIAKKILRKQACRNLAFDVFLLNLEAAS